LSRGAKVVAIFNYVTDDEAEPLTLQLKDVGFSGPIRDCYETHPGVHDLNWTDRELEPEIQAFRKSVEFGLSCS
jgi:hypothetical protein